MINQNLKKYKNIDKRENLVFQDPMKFALYHIKNQEDNVQYKKFVLDQDYIQLYFCSNNRLRVAINMEHCAIDIDTDTSGILYFKSEEKNLLFTMPPASELTMILVSVSYFHSLFAHEGDYFFNFNALKGGKPIIEQKPVSLKVKEIINQIVKNNIHDSLKEIYSKGKLYELLSVYFNVLEDTPYAACPFMANEETVSQIKKVKDIIIDQMADPPGLDELAVLVGLNVKKIKMGFKEFYGEPVFTFLLNYKMDYSKKLLEENQLNVSEIALKLGYSTSSHFITAFKKKYGITPKQFTKQHLNL